MEIKIGIENVHKELTCRIKDKGHLEALLQRVAAAVGERSGLIWFEDDDGTRIGVPADKLAYLEVESDKERPVGFARR